jgi:hypothetical protein
MNGAIGYRLLAIGLACAIGGPLAAQEETGAHPHRGFWIGFGLGGGVNLSEGLDGQQLGGGGFYFRLGGTPSQKVLLGFESIGWARELNGATVGRGNGSFVMQFYPSERGGAFLKGGVGFSTISRATVSGNTTTATSESGFGLTLGAGWDVRLGRNIYLVPNLDLLLQWFSAQNDPVLGPIPGNNSILLFTLGLTWH